MLPALRGVGVCTIHATRSRAARNLKTAKVVSSRYVTVFDILNADSIVITQPALTAINDWLGKEAK